jgi:hypothetical protein
MKILAACLPLVLLSCHESPAAIAAQTIDLTNYACAVAADQPAGQPTVDLICTLLEGGEQFVTVIVGAFADGGAAATAASIRVPLKQVRITLPATQAPAFLAAHRR